MDHIARFGLEFNPFLKNSKEILVENENPTRFDGFQGSGCYPPCRTAPVKQYPAHEPLRQRLVMNYNMEGLSKEEGRIIQSDFV